jgi:hypothetical protein
MYIVASKIFIIAFIAFYIAAMATLDVGNYPGSWSWSSALRKVVSCRGALGDDAFSAWHVIISCIAFTIATTLLYRINIGHRYQDHFLFAGITTGVGIGFIQGKGLQPAILNFMPWTTMLALMCSIILHALLPEQEDTMLDEKLNLLG